MESLISAFVPILHRYLVFLSLTGVATNLSWAALKGLCDPNQASLSILCASHNLAALQLNV